MTRSVLYPPLQSASGPRLSRSGRLVRAAGYQRLTPSASHRWNVSSRVVRTESGAPILSRSRDNGGLTREAPSSRRARSKRCRRHERHATRSSLATQTPGTLACALVPAIRFSSYDLTKPRSRTESPRTRTSRPSTKTPLSACRTANVACSKLFRDSNSRSLTHRSAVRRLLTGRYSPVSASVDEETSITNCRGRPSAFSRRAHRFAYLKKAVTPFIHESTMMTSRRWRWLFRAGSQRPHQALAA